MDERARTNRQTWDAWTRVNYDSDFYDVEGFVAGRSTRGRRLEELDARLLGDVAGRSLLHLQCHFGLDTLQQVRRGARAVGVDFSPEAIGRARELARRVELDDRCEFVESDVLELDLGRTFDLVFSSWGVLGWLADLDRWAAVVARHLAPGGRFVLIEGHPFALVFGDRPGDGQIEADGASGGTATTSGACGAASGRVARYALRYPYFGGEPLRLESDRVYSEPDLEVRSVTYEWQHSLAEIFSALLRGGLRIERFEELSYCAWPMYPWMERRDDGSWEQPAEHPRLPLAFALVASRPEGPRHG